MRRWVDVLVLALLSLGVCASEREAIMIETVAVVRLPEPRPGGEGSVEAALGRRRSVREWSRRPVTLADASQLLWAAQGVTTSDGRRTAPSAGALYPLEVSLVAGQVVGLPAGVYRYRPEGHQLERVHGGDRRRALAEAALGQSCVRDAPLSLVVAAVHERTARKYGARAERYVAIEVGAAAENVALQAVSLGLGTVIVGAFDDQAVSRVVGLGPSERPAAIVPAGYHE
jgi:SagB-type dehydrogenase family enzyme